MNHRREKLFLLFKGLSFKASETAAPGHRSTHSAFVIMASGADTAGPQVCGEVLGKGHGPFWDHVGQVSLS